MKKISIIIYLTLISSCFSCTKRRVTKENFYYKDGSLEKIKYIDYSIMKSIDLVYYVDGNLWFVLLSDILENKQIGLFYDSLGEVNQIINTKDNIKNGWSFSFQDNNLVKGILYDMNKSLDTITFFYNAKHF